MNDRMNLSDRILGTMRDWIGSNLVRSGRWDDESSGVIQQSFATLPCLVEHVDSLRCTSHTHPRQLARMSKSHNPTELLNVVVIHGIELTQSPVQASHPG